MSQPIASSEDQEEPRTYVLSNVPPVIWLNVSGEDELDQDEDFNDLEEVTWCAAKMTGSDVRYVRAEPAETELESLRAQLAAAEQKGERFREALVEFAAGGEIDRDGDFSPERGGYIYVEFHPKLVAILHELTQEASR